jgi:hypothetical protein
MPKMILSTHSAEMVGGHVQIAITQDGPLPRRTVEIARLADCVAAIEAYKADAVATGKPMVVCIDMARGHRKPAGFNRLMPRDYEPVNL